MARFRRYRKYSRRNRSRWSSNLIDVGPNTFSLTPGNFSHTEYTLITNPDYSNSLTSNLYTIKNVEVSINFDMANLSYSSNIENLQFYIMYVPQGMYVSEDYAIKHPEYIMAMRYYGEPGKESVAQSYATSITPALRIKTRLSRKLNSGDRIILFIRGCNTHTSDTFEVVYGGICRWWTKAN